MRLLEGVALPPRIKCLAVAPNGRTDVGGLFVSHSRGAVALYLTVTTEHGEGNESIARFKL